MVTMRFILTNDGMKSIDANDLIGTGWIKQINFHDLVDRSAVDCLDKYGVTDTVHHCTGYYDNSQIVIDGFTHNSHFIREVNALGIHNLHNLHHIIYHIVNFIFFN